MDGDDDSDEKTPPRKLSALPIEPLPPPPAFPGDPATSPDLTPPADPTLEVDVRRHRPLRWWQKMATRGDLILAGLFLLGVALGWAALVVAWCR